MKNPSVRLLIWAAVLLVMAHYGVFWSKSLNASHKKRSLTVFVHGTVLGFMAITSPSLLMNGDVSDDSWYIQFLNAARDKSSTYSNRLMEERGFRFIDRSHIETLRMHGSSPQSAEHGSYFILSAYDSIARECGRAVEHDDYALFGWSGLLLNRARQEAAIQLYDHLVALKYSYKEINLVTYSHGGNVALWLAHFEDQHKRGLSINRLIMMGAPIQRETVPFVASDFFKSIINVRSDGDEVQVVDSVSTSLGESFSYMQDLIDLGRLQRNNGLERIDLSIVVNNVSTQINHFNMYMLGIVPGIHEYIDPHPLVIFIPALISAVEANPDFTEGQIKLECADKDIKIHFSGKKHLRFIDQGCLPYNFFSILERERALANVNWRGRIHISQSMFGQLYQLYKGL